MTTEEVSGFWGVVELMGHTRLAGFVTEEEKFGTKLGRIDIPRSDDGSEATTVYFGGSSIYRITPTTEPVARSIARTNQPRVVQPWELPQLQSAASVANDDAAMRRIGDDLASERDGCLDGDEVGYYDDDE